MEDIEDTQSASNDIVEKKKVNGRDMLAHARFNMGYSRWDDDKGRYETWEEAVERVMNMHRQKYADKMTPELNALFDEAEEAYKNKLVVGAQRALQFGGEQLMAHNARCFNCSSSYVDRPEFFNECMYLLLCGVGVGASVQKHHVAKLPKVQARSKTEAKVFVIPDSIEGWSDAVGVLLSSYFVEGGTHPEYRGYPVHFDFSKIRPKGAKISGGFKAPGPDGLRKSLEKCEAILDKFAKQTPKNLTPIVCYDIIAWLSEAVLSGGVRRSAILIMFSKDDQDMLTAKTGNWGVNNPQRARSNNSAMLLRDDITRDEWANIMKSVKQFGEPGFIFTDDLDHAYNPCVEIGMIPQIEGKSGFQFCNLTDINGGVCHDKEIFLKACRAASILGTLQAGYTDFKYVSDATRRITEKESLIGVAVTGWMNNPDVLFDEQTMKEGAETVKQVNKKVAELIGINQAARCCCVKPSGNTSVMLGCSYGIHAEHAPLYFRHMQMNKEDEVTQLFLKYNPKMCEQSLERETDIVVAFPIETKEGSIFKNDCLGVKQLEYVKKVQNIWVEHGTNSELGTNNKVRHNVSNTITVDNWDDVEQYIFDNRHHFAGISLLSAYGDRAYTQAPLCQVYTPQQILEAYGDAALFASGLIVDAMHAFNQDLWLACSTLLGHGLELSDESVDLQKRDWVRRAKKFADNYFDGDLTKMTFCLKDVHNRHKWDSIQNTIQEIDFSKKLKKKKYIEVDTMGAQACAGGKCEL